MIQLKTYLISDKLTLTNEVLASYIHSFWSDIFNDIKDNNHLMLMCKVQFTDESEGYRTLGNLRRVNFSDKELFIEYLSERLSILNESYVTQPISKVMFSYIIKSGKCNESNRRLLRDLSSKGLTTHRFNNRNLPITTIPSEYGEIRSSMYIQIKSDLVHRFIVNSGTKNFQIDVSSNGLVNKVNILGAINLSWVDTILGEGLFKREIGKSTIYFLDGEILLRKQILPAKAFRNLGID